MSKHLGDYDLSTVIYGKFTTFRPSTGAAFTLGGTPALSVYKDNSNTQSTTGVTLTADFDSLTGLNHFAIDTSADGTFYSAGSNFDIVITTGTVDSVSVVGSVVASFSIRKTSALKPTTAGRTLDVSATGEAGLDWANIGSPTTAVNLSGTNIDVDQVVASVSGAVGSVTGDVGGNVTGSVGTVNALAANVITAAATATDFTTEIQAGLATSADLSTVAGYLDTEIAAILADTNELQTDWANGGRLDLILDARASQASVDVIDGIVDSILVDTAEIGAAGAGLTAVASAANLATLAGYVDTEVAAIKVTTDKLDETLVASSDGFIFTAAALQDAPTGGSAPSAATIAAAVWEEPIASHSGTSGSTAEALAAAGASGDPWITALPGAYMAGQAGYIIGTNLNATVSSRASQTSVDDLPTNAELATALGTSDDAVLAVLGTPAGASLAADVAAVQADTNDLQTRVPAALVSGRMDASVGAMAANVMTAAAAAADLTTELQSGLATAANLATVAGYLDTEIASILATTTKLDSLLENSSDGWIYTVAALQQAPVGGSGLDAAGVRAAIGLASANLDTQLDALPTAAENATAVMGSTVEGTFDLTESARLWNAALAGKASGLATATATFRDLADGKDRIVATVDADGNRTAVTRDVT